MARKLDPITYSRASVHNDEPWESGFLVHEATTGADDVYLLTHCEAHSTHCLAL